MAQSSLTPKQVRTWAGWIPAKTTLIILMVVYAVLGLLLRICKIELNLLDALSLFIALVITTIVTTVFVWRWGSNQGKYWILMLQEMIKSQNKTLKELNALPFERRKRYYKGRVTWHERALQDAQVMLRLYGQKRILTLN